MLRLRWLTIHEFRDVTPGTELRFHEGINLILGQNGSGKTTLLELISGVLRLNFEPWKNEAFDIEFEIERHEEERHCTMHGRVVGQIAKRLSQSQLAGFDGSGQQTAHFTFVSDGAIACEIVQKQGRIQLLSHNEILAEQTASATVTSDFLLEVWSIPEINLSTNAFFFAIYTNHNCKRRFDEALMTFDEVTGNRSTRRHPTSVYFGGTSVVTLFLRALCFAPQSLFDAANDIVEQTPDISTLTIEHTLLPFLERTADLCGFQSAQMTLSLLARTEADTTRTTFGDARFYFTRKSGRRTITHDKLSYGQKRLLALLFYLEANEDIIIIDELINGLHHAWLEDIMPDVLQRQAFLTSQNPLLFDYLEFSSTEDVERAFVLCSVDHDTDRMTWRNASPDEAERFLKAYDVGIQHISEILRTMGLW